MTFDGFLFYLFWGSVALVTLAVIEFFWERWDRSSRYNVQCTNK